MDDAQGVILNIKKLEIFQQMGDDILSASFQIQIQLFFLIQLSKIQKSKEYYHSLYLSSRGDHEMTFKMHNFDMKSSLKSLL